MLVAPRIIQKHACIARNIQENSCCAPPTQPSDCYYYLPNQPHRGGRPSNGEARKERIRDSTWGAPRERREGREVDNKKEEDLPQGKTRWRKREETIDVVEAQKQVYEHLRQLGERRRREEKPSTTLPRRPEFIKK